MNVFKITHNTIMEDGFQTHYTIVPANTKEEATKKINPHIIVSIDDLGEQKKDVYGEWWDVWNAKGERKEKELRKEIYKIKSPSHKK